MGGAHAGALYQTPGADIVGASGEQRSAGADKPVGGGGCRNDAEAMGLWRVPVPQKGEECDKSLRWYSDNAGRMAAIAVAVLWPDG
ncbi:hypothetical protein DU260_24865 [Salmonella enterica subsp. salamae]|nr:hypothetical protein [Salmonella enterica subsp. salamae]ECI5306566.1 hypothetical protein [Salmonella enterica subsp. salamae]